jgi:hypothetical protein
VEALPSLSGGRAVLRMAGDQVRAVYMQYTSSRRDQVRIHEDLYGLLL